MLIVLKKGASKDNIDRLQQLLLSFDLDFTLWQDDSRYFCGLSRTPDLEVREKISNLSFVHKIAGNSPSPAISLQMQEIKLQDRIISRDNFTVIAGPCTIDDRDTLRDTAKSLKDLGVGFLRGGAYKLRSSPHSYQGLGEKALSLLKETCEEFGLLSVSEIIALEDLEKMQQYVDILIIGTRNMQNYPLLSALGKTKIPVILKRGMANTIKEWILAAEYIAKEGNRNIILCERGIRTFENYTRNTLDISAVPVSKELTPYPVIVDPSHSSGRRELVKPLAWAAAAAGADGVIIECHTNPRKAKCDARQTISIETMQDIIEKLPELTGIWRKTF